MARHTDEQAAPEAARADGLDRVSRLEWAVAAVAAVVLAGLVAAEPDVLEAPFENTLTVMFTLGGTAVAALALVVMLRLRVHPTARVLVLGIPFVAVSWWLLSPFFLDDVVDDDFTTSIADARSTPQSTNGPDLEPRESTASIAVPLPVGPMLRGAGEFVGLAGHDGSGDAGFFALEGGSHVLRLENFNIDNGPDLRLYVVPGSDQTGPTEDSLNLGELRGNVGNQSYDLPGDFSLTPGEWTVLVWCEAFSVEFAAATVTVA